MKLPVDVEFPVVVGIPVVELPIDRQQELVVELVVELPAAIPRFSLAKASRFSLAIVSRFFASFDERLGTSSHASSATSAIEN